MSQGRNQDVRQTAPQRVGHAGQPVSGLRSDHANPSGQETSTSASSSRPPREHTQNQTDGSQHGHPLPSPMPSQPDPYNMSNMSHSLANLNQQHTHSYPSHMSPGAPRSVVMSPQMGTMYAVPSGFTYSPASPYHTPSVYVPYQQTHFVHGYAPTSGHPGAYNMYPQDSIRQDAMSPQTGYNPVPAPYYVYQDPYAGHPQQSHSPTRSRQGATSGAQAGRGRAYGRHHLSEPPNRNSTVVFPAHSAASPISGRPPRKPKQSGFAIWVGNLPPTATILSMKEHFSQGFSREIESLFLISKSNCAFVNYRTEDACNRAIKRFHDSRFDSVRLVCRLRKASVVKSTSPAEAAVAVTDDEVEDDESPRRSATVVDGHDESQEKVEVRSVSESDGLVELPKTGSKRYFIVKSLTLQDLEQSVRNAIWATQVHNEDILNDAFKTSEIVFLIFSVNKSGEYYGYARMETSIEVDAVENLGPIKRASSTGSSGQFISTTTAATEDAPRGHITDDMSRGTIFWEADYTDEETDGTIDDLDNQIPAEEQTWGKPFKVQWMSTTSVPFWRTKGIRNPWNANREVKIARDGTELEPGVGERLLKLFHPMEIS